MKEYYSDDSVTILHGDCREFDGKADPESRDIVRLTVSILMDAYDFGREAEAAAFITMAEQRRGTWKDVNKDARRA